MPREGENGLPLERAAAAGVFATNIQLVTWCLTPGWSQQQNKKNRYVRAKLNSSNHKCKKSHSLFKTHITSCFKGTLRNEDEWTDKAESIGKAKSVSRWGKQVKRAKLSWPTPGVSRGTFDRGEISAVGPLFSASTVSHRRGGGGVTTRMFTRKDEPTKIGRRLTEEEKRWTFPSRAQQLDWAVRTVMPHDLNLCRHLPQCTHMPPVQPT